MGDNSQKGLGSDNMSDETKHTIQSEGGRASQGGGRSSDSGMKGGQSSQQQNSGSQGRDEQGQFTENSEEASEAGRMGGSR